MPPKNKGKKGKKQDDDEYWCVGSYNPQKFMLHTLMLVSFREKAGESVAANTVESTLGSNGNDDYAPQSSKRGFGGFASLGVDVGDVGEDEEEDFGGLMVSILVSSVFIQSCVGYISCECLTSCAFTQLLELSLTRDMYATVCDQGIIKKT